MKGKVGVGIAIARDPLHGSGQAGFPHPALALGDNAHASQGRYHLRQEPDAGNPPVRIRGGGRE